MEDMVGNSGDLGWGTRKIWLGNIVWIRRRTIQVHFGHSGFETAVIVGSQKLVAWE